MVSRRLGSETRNFGINRVDEGQNMTKMTESSVNRRLSDEGLTLKTPSSVCYNTRPVYILKGFFPLSAIPWNIFTFQTAH